MEIAPTQIAWKLVHLHIQSPGYLKWGHVYKMVASMDASPPGKWFSIYKITDAIVWR